MKCSFYCWFPGDNKAEKSFLKCVNHFLLHVFIYLEAVATYPELFWIFELFKLLNENEWRFQNFKNQQLLWFNLWGHLRAAFSMNASLGGPTTSVACCSHILFSFCSIWQRKSCLRWFRLDLKKGPESSSICSFWHPASSGLLKADLSSLHRSYFLFILYVHNRS